MKRWNQADTVNDGPVNSGDRLSRYASPRSLTTWQVVSKSDSPRVLQCIVRELEGASKGICWNRSWSSGGLDCTLDLQWQRECFRRCNQLQVMSKAPYTFDIMCPPKIRNKLQHAVTGNWCTTRQWKKPHHKSHLWATSFTLYNGMLVFDFKDSGASFEVYAYRRGQYFIFCSDQLSSPKLYKSLRNAITAKKGEPGCRRHQEDRLLHNVMSGLRVGSCGNENRDAFAGRSHRGFRSQEATNRRIQKRNDRRKDARQSYRAFYAKGSGRDEADHGLLQPPAPRPKQAVYDRSQMLLKSSGCATNNASISRAVLSTAVAPCKLRSSALKLASWNVEGMREIGKYDQVFAFMQKPSVHILAMKETHSECSQEFSKSGYLVLHSSSPKAPKHGVGFIIAPRLRPYVHSFLPLGPRLCSILVSTSPKPLRIICGYAPSMVQDAAEDKRRKTEFWEHFQDFLGTVESPQQLIILGDFNSRLDNGLDESQVHVGPHVWGKRLSLDTPDRDNALQLLETLQGFDLKLPQTYLSVPFAQRVTYKETTCADHLLERPQVNEWTTLDYVITSLEPAFEVAFIRSFFPAGGKQQTFTSRLHAEAEFACR